LDTSASKPGHRRFFLLLFGLSLAAYGRLLLQPGVFGDDPQLLYAFHRFGLAGYRDALGYSRPFGGWVYTLLYPLAGGQPLAWQFCALLLRSAGAGLLFDLLRRLGPGWRAPAVWAALLCLLYPGFSQQAHALQFALHWAALCAALGSQILMLRAAAAKDRRKSLPLLFSSLILCALGIFSTEYFFGLELLRPLLLRYFIKNGKQSSRKGRMQLWLPYLFISIVFIFWRLKMAQIPYPRPLLMEAWLANPAAALRYLLSRIAPDLWKAGGAAWVNSFSFNRSNTSLWLYLSLGGALTAAICLACRKDLLADHANRRAGLLLICAGFLSMLAGEIPLLVSQTPLELDFPQNRTTLCLMVGACLMAAGLLRLLPARAGWLAAALLSGFSAAFQFDTVQGYAGTWRELNSFYSQLAHCAPSLQPGTAILYEEPFIPAYPANSLAALLNWTYDADNTGEAFSYDMLRISERLGNELPALQMGLPIRHGNFSGSTSRVLAVALDAHGCLQILRPADEHNQGLPPLLRQAARISNPGGVILASAKLTNPPPFLDLSVENADCGCR